MSSQIENLLNVHVDELEKMSDAQLTELLKPYFEYTNPTYKMALEGKTSEYKEKISKPAPKVKGGDTSVNKMLAEMFEDAKKAGVDLTKFGL